MASPDIDAQSAAPELTLHLSVHSDRELWNLLVSNTKTVNSETRGKSFELRIYTKTLRERSAQGFQDQFCELLVTNLGSALDVPVLPMHLVYLNDLGPCLVSPHLGETRLGTPPDPSLAPQLRALAVFEEWVMNQDDKPDHFRVVTYTDGSIHVFLLDHGHCLHGWQGGMTTIEAVRSHPQLVLPSSQYKPYGIADFRDPEPFARQVRAIQDAEIADIIGQALDEYEALRGAIPDVENLLRDRTRHELSAQEILIRRRDSLDDILRTKYPAQLVPS